VLLILAPVAVYWSTVFHDYGFRDDYAHLREVNEEPGKLLRFTTSNGRPVYGVLLESSVRLLRGVPDLPWLRLTCVLFLAATGVALWAQLRRRGWSDAEAAAIGLCVAFLPAAQVFASWAITGRRVRAVARRRQFALVDWRLERRAGRASPPCSAAGCQPSRLIYQSTRCSLSCRSRSAVRPGRGVARTRVGRRCRCPMRGAPHRFHVVDSPSTRASCKSERMYFETRARETRVVLQATGERACAVCAARQVQHGAAFFWAQPLCPWS
jgi:hypothetical protein